MEASAARWFDLAAGDDDEEGEARPGPSASPWSSAPLRDVSRASARNGQSYATVLEALQGLREAAARGAAAVREDAALVAAGSPPGPLLARASAFASRMATARRLMEQSSLRGSPSAAAGRIAEALSRAIRASGGEAQRYPGVVRAASGRTLNEMRQLLDAGTREVAAAAAEAERAASSFRETHVRQGEGARREAERTALSLRDRVLGSDAFVQLRRDVEEAGRLAGGETPSLRSGSLVPPSLSLRDSGALRAPRSEELQAAAADVFAPDDPFLALPAHLEGLRRASLAEAIAREAECALLAFRAFQEAARGSRLSARTVPASLLEQIASAERRREMSTMPRDRALSLLQHTRRAIGKALEGPTSSSGADALRKLRVVESILEIRARGEDDTGGDASRHAVAVMADIARRWSMWGSSVVRGLERVARSGRLAVEIAARSEAARSETVSRMRSLLAKSTADAARRVAQGSDSKSQRWRDEVCGAYSSGEAALLREGQELADAVTAGLDLFVGTGMLLGGAGGGDEEDEDAAADDEEADVPLVAVTDWRRDRDARADEFAFSGEAPAAARTSGSSSRLLRRTHALALEGYVAWVEYTSAVLLTNAAGTGRASAAVREALEPSRRKFMDLVRAHAGGEAAGAAS
jgi:hypothetical protein